MSLPVIRYLASRRQPRIGSLFVNTGGALGSVRTVREDGAAFAAMLGGDRFDVIGWALRGTAGARPAVRCFTDDRSRTQFWDGLSIPTTRAQGRAYLPKTIAYARRCRKLSAGLLAHVSTADDARDLDYLRRLVGDGQLTYWGASYATFLGLTYANLFPRRVRAMTLDGVLDPRVVDKGAEARFGDTGSATDRAFAKFQSLCQAAGAARCALAGGGSVVARVRRLMVRLRRAPIPAPSARPAGALRYSELLLDVFNGLQAGPAGWPRLAADLNQAASGDGSALATEARASLPGLHSAAADASEAIACTDSPARQAPRTWPRVISRLTRISYIGGPIAGWGNWAPCASWPKGGADRYTGPWSAQTKHPVLVIGTTFDPNTPYVNSRHVAALLGNAVLLTHAGYGHTSGADPSACVINATRSYLVNLLTPPRATVCGSDRQPFDPAFG